jgi:urease accessory protein
MTASLQKLLTWLSPAFPVGAFAWSAGLETAIAERRITDSAALQNWLGGTLAHGGLKTDAILLAQAWKSGAARSPSPTTGEDGTGDEPLATLATLADLAIALTPARERLMETSITGDSFAIALKAWPVELREPLPTPCPYPIAVGAVAAAHGVPLHETLLAFLTAAVHGQISVAVRLVPLGQTDGLKVMAALEPAIAAMAEIASTSSLADIGGIAYATDIAQMQHETLEPRIFRS